MQTEKSPLKEWKERAQGIVENAILAAAYKPTKQYSKVASVTFHCINCSTEINKIDLCFNNINDFAWNLKYLIEDKSLCLCDKCKKEVYAS